MEITLLISDFSLDYLIRNQPWLCQWPSDMVWVELLEYSKLAGPEGCAVDEMDSIGRKLFVGNIDFRITELQILKLFRKYGTIKKEEFLWNKSGPNQGRPRGVCFIEYATVEVNRRAH